MKLHLIDTNIIIYYFNGSFPLDIKEQIEIIFETSFYISVITKIEFLGWKKHTKGSFKKAQFFLSYAQIIDLTDEIVDIAINLRRTASIKTPDALIAATAIQNDAILVTRNTKDFNSIKQMTVFNPFELKK